MKRIDFLIWAGKQGLKSKVLQKYLNTVWNENTKGGKVILQTHFPKLLNKAKEYHEGFKRAGLKVVKKVDKALEKVGIKDKTITDKKGQKFIFDPKTGKTLEEKVVGPGAKIIKFPKKPPTLKADGGRIDKALPKKSRDI
jgi:lipopolysaccharide export LptBFGC system permease protein LptF